MYRTWVLCTLLQRAGFCDQGQVASHSVLPFPHLLNMIFTPWTPHRVAEDPEIRHGKDPKITTFNTHCNIHPAVWPRDFLTHGRPSTTTWHNVTVVPAPPLPCIHQLVFRLPKFFFVHLCPVILSNVFNLHTHWISTGSEWGAIQWRMRAFYMDMGAHCLHVLWFLIGLLLFRCCWQTDVLWTVERSLSPQSTSHEGTTTLASDRLAWVLANCIPGANNGLTCEMKIYLFWVMNTKPGMK